MSPVVVDTDVVSLIFKRHSLSEKYIDTLDGNQVVISFMTLAELRLWTRRRSWGVERRELLARFLDRFTICHSDDALCDVWSAIRHNAFASGTVIDVADAWVAATAVYLDARLVTHNRSHFEHVAGLNLVSHA
jgi:predicted nucleic acid-binding protein